MMPTTCDLAYAANQQLMIEYLTGLLFVHGATLVPLIEPGYVPLSKITVSSSWDEHHDERHCMINYSGAIGGSHAWSAKTNDLNQWIQAELPEPTVIAAIEIRKRGDAPQWVKQFRVYQSLNGVDFHPVYGGPFLGLTDSEERKKITFSIPVRTRFIRINPMEWNGHISLRWEIYTIK